MLPVTMRSAPSAGSKPAIPAAPFCLVSPRFCIGHYTRCPAKLSQASPFRQLQQFPLHLEQVSPLPLLRLHPSLRLLLRHSHRCLQTSCVFHTEGSGSAPLEQPTFSFGLPARITSSAGWRPVQLQHGDPLKFSTLSR